MKKIEFVYFDLGNILVSFSPDRACQNVAQLFGVTHQQALAAVYESGLQDEYEHGFVSGTEYAARVKSHLDLPGHIASESDILRAISDMFDPIESMAQSIEFARQKVGRIGILSNTCVAHWDWVRSRPWKVSQPEFDVVVLSCEVGSMKPANKIYEVAQQKSGVAPENILFIDDKPENVSAAKAMGWNAEVCLGGEQAQSVLQRALQS